MMFPKQITISRLEADEQTCASARRLLSPDECERMETFRNEERRRSFAVGRLAARTLLADQLSLRPQDVPLEVRDDGSVGIPGDTMHVSISHSGPHVLAAVAPHPIGVDLEVVRVRPVTLYRFILHPTEIPYVDRLPGTDDERIAMLWAIKESVLKGRRTGLRHSPKSLRLFFPGSYLERPNHLAVQPEITSVLTPGDDPDWKSSFSVSDGVAVSVAWPDT